MSGAAESEQDSVPQRLRENVVGIASVLVTAVWMGALFTHQDWWLAAMLVGYVAVVPTVTILFGDGEDREEWLDPNSHGESTSQETSEETPLETLRRRYAEGELTEAQFERKLDQLLETETMEAAEEYARRRDGGRATERER